MDEELSVDPGWRVRWTRDAFPVRPPTLFVPQEKPVVDDVVDDTVDDEPIVEESADEPVGVLDGDGSPADE